MSNAVFSFLGFACLPVPANLGTSRDTSSEMSESFSPSPPPTATCPPTANPSACEHLIPIARAASWARAHHSEHKKALLFAINPASFPHTYLVEILSAHELTKSHGTPYIAQRGGGPWWLSFGAAFGAIFDGSPCEYIHTLFHRVVGLCTGVWRRIFRSEPHGQVARVWHAVMLILLTMPPLLTTPARTTPTSLELV